MLKHFKNWVSCVNPNQIYHLHAFQFFNIFKTPLVCNFAMLCSQFGLLYRFPSRPPDPIHNQPPWGSSQRYVTPALVRVASPGCFAILTRALCSLALFLKPGLPTEYLAFPSIISLNLSNLGLPHDHTQKQYSSTDEQALFGIRLPSKYCPGLGII